LVFFAIFFRFRGVSGGVDGGDGGGRLEKRMMGPALDAADVARVVIGAWRSFLMA
jgi:hypothetical protein